MRSLASVRRNALAGAALLFATATAVAAQSPGQQTGTMPGLTSNRDQPVKIESTTLEVRDKQREATFIGDVKLTQGDTVIRCTTLVVFYEDSAATAQSAPAKGTKTAANAPTANAPGGGQQSIKRVEARGNVIVTQKDQTASGDNGVFDTKANTITLTGNVVVTQGQNVMRGARMVVDLTTGLYRVESVAAQPAKPGSRVEASKTRVEVLIIPGQTKGVGNAPAAAPTPGPGPASAAQPPAKSSGASGGAPLRLNRLPSRGGVAG